MFSFSTPQAQSQAPAAPANTSLSLDRLTRVSDLPADAQNLIESLDTYISSQTSIAEQLKLNGEQGEAEAVSIDTDVQECRRRHVATTSLLLTDQMQLEQSRAAIQKDFEHAYISTRFIDGVRSGTINPRGSADHILQYFTGELEETRQSITQYENYIEQLFAHATALQHDEIDLHAETLQQSLRAQHQAFLAVCSQFAVVHDKRVQTLPM